MRTQRNNITLDVDSALALMQEIYNDVVENRNTASTILRKMMSFMKDAEDMSTIGPVIKEQQKILNDCTEKKISLVKLQSVLLKQTTGSTGGGGGSMGKLTLSDEDREMLDRLVNDGNDNKSSNYSLECLKKLNPQSMLYKKVSIRQIRNYMTVFWVGF